MNRDQALARFETDVMALNASSGGGRHPEILGRARRVYLLGPTSFLELGFAASIAQKLGASGTEVVCVDDGLASRRQPFGEYRVLDTKGFVEDARRHPGALSVNLGNSVFAACFFSQASQRAGVQELDIIPVLDFLELPVIYQTAACMRAATLERLDDYRALARRFQDPLSIRTLGALLELRLTLERRAVLPVLCSLENEYFAPYAAGEVDTFRLGEREVLVDVGAHVGTTIGKFLTATRWKYQSIHAFEPDRENYAALERGYFATLDDFHAYNMALSDTRSTLQFAQTGTMGSRIDQGGNVQVQALPLDEVLDHATFIKMDVEGHETSVLRGARKLIATHRPRLAVTGYHYADDLLDIVRLLDEIEPSYDLRLRHHSYYYYDSILYAEARS
ncbi:FkbM family methyltransferase [Pseudomonas aeruginosa]|uniref:FkbM family methyltransferase n=1 Tax=Pseudomonas aeruginosa TaxID=287 RepID=UPI001AAFBF5F|nr:FkbM family methyltransferase [Pseudomonas aeruginosa]